MTIPSTGPNAVDVDSEHCAHVVVVGAGLSGIAAAAKLRRAGIFDFVVLERADRVGGTWRDNTYPGCAVDIPAPVYSFSFHPNPDWSRNFPTQPELLAYIEDTVDKFGVAGHLRLGTELVEAAWSDSRRRWVLTTTRGRFVAQHVIFATGVHSTPILPDVSGLESFGGQAFHSACWDHNVDLAGKRVAVVGTGCSSVQLVPEIQPIVERLYVFQRTPAWVVPRLDVPFPVAVRRLFRRLPVAQRMFKSFLDLDLRVLALVMQRASVARLLHPMARWMLRRQVPDAALRRLVTPDFTIGCKRLLLSNTYLPALCKSNVELIPHALAKVCGDELVAADGTRIAADVIIFGSGFELRHPPIAGRIRCRDGRLLSEVWSRESPKAYRSTTIPGAPNAYLLLGPNIVMYNSLLALSESQLDYVIDAVRTAREQGLDALEIKPGPFRSFNEELARDLRPTVYNNGGCSSFYLDEHGRNFVASPWSFGRVRRDLSRFDIENYDTVRAGAPGGAEAG